MRSDFIQELRSSHPGAMRAHIDAMRWLPDTKSLSEIDPGARILQVVVALQSSNSPEPDSKATGSDSCSSPQKRVVLAVEEVGVSKYPPTGVGEANQNAVIVVSFSEVSLGGGVAYLNNEKQGWMNGLLSAALRLSCDSLILVSWSHMSGGLDTPGHLATCCFVIHGFSVTVSC